jgi:L-gulonolactone oxidase
MQSLVNWDNEIKFDVPNNKFNLARFRSERNFLIALPIIIYFIEQDSASLLSRSRNSNMVVIDPEQHEPRDPRWHEFRWAFGELVLKHGGILHINKTFEATVR